jgi:hypothetical protein
VVIVNSFKFFKTAKDVVFMFIYIYRKDVVCSRILSYYHRNDVILVFSFKKRLLGLLITNC